MNFKLDKLNKNQIVVYSIVLMLVVAGYLNYIENDKSVEISANTQNTTNIGDATLVSNNETAEESDSNVLEQQEQEEAQRKEENKQIEEAKKEIMLLLKTDDIILLKASHGMHLEEIADFITGENGEEE